MKKVFISISVLAIVYLGLQSGIAKNISLPNWDAVFNQTQDKEESVAAIQLALKAELQEALQVMKAENNALKEKLLSLEAKLDSTELDSSEGNNQALKNTETNKVIDIAQLPESANVSSYVPIADKADTGSNKRLQQQALLRSVAQRMELSALSSLSK